jgi:hypothetical protein
VLYCLLELAEWHGVFVEAREPRYGVSPPRSAAGGVTHSAPRAVTPPGHPSPGPLAQA